MIFLKPLGTHSTYANDNPAWGDLILAKYTWSFLKYADFICVYSLGLIPLETKSHLKLAHKEGASPEDETKSLMTGYPL